MTQAYVILGTRLLFLRSRHPGERQRGFMSTMGNEDK
jgi:hypothetical protein